MKKLFLIIIMTSLTQLAIAAKLPSIYEAKVPVVSQGDQQREQAIQQAFVQTMTKLTGNADILKNPTIKAAVPNAKNEVDQYGYVPSGVASTPYLLKVQFDAKAMKRLLRQAQAPIWDENRPLVLVWLAYDNPGKPVEIVDNQSTSEVAQALKKQADLRGLPLILPMMDITDINQVSVEDIRSRSADALDKVSGRYNSDAILIGSIQQNGKLFQGQWKLIQDDDVWEWTLSSDTIQGMVSQLTDKMVNTLAGRYASVQNEETSSSLTVVIKGIAQQDDFENIMRFIKHISLIKELEVENVLGDQVILRLDVQGERQAFMQEALVGRHLKLESEKENELTYTWLR